MTLLDDTLTAAADLGRAAAIQATGAATVAGRGLSDVAQQGQAVLEDFGGTIADQDRPRGRRLMALAIIAAIAGLIIWRRRSGQGKSEHESAADAPGTSTTPGIASTPELAMSPNVDVAALTDAYR
jgi:hypothetical protein